MRSSSSRRRCGAARAKPASPPPIRYRIFFPHAPSPLAPARAQLTWLPLGAQYYVGAEGVASCATWLYVAALLILPLSSIGLPSSHEYGFRDDYAHLREVRERPGLADDADDGARPARVRRALEASLRCVHRVTSSRMCARSAPCSWARRRALWRQLRRSGWTRRAELRRRRRRHAAARRTSHRRLGHRLAGRAWAAWRRSRALRSSERGFATTGSRAPRARGRGRRALLRLQAPRIRRARCSRSCRSWPLLLLREGTTTGAMTVDHRAHRRPVRRARRGVPRRCALFAGRRAGGHAHRTSSPHRRQIPLVPAQSAAELARRCSRCATASRRRSWFWFVVAGVVAIIGARVLYTAPRNRQQRLRWLFAALLLPFVAHSVSLARARRRSATARCCLSSGLFLVLRCSGCAQSCARHRVPRTLETGVLAGRSSSCAFLAQRNASR